MEYFRNFMIIKTLKLYKYPTNLTDKQWQVIKNVRPQRKIQKIFTALCF